MVFAYADGASRGNPGHAGAGWVLCRGTQAPFARGHLYLGHRTNNEAEYLAASCALQAAADLGLTHVTLRADSELLVRQINGIYRVKNVRLKPLYDALLSHSRVFVAFAAEHVRREYNALADAEANAAIDAHLGTPAVAHR